MSALITGAGFITRPDSQLDDREMKVFDHKAKVHREVDWRSFIWIARYYTGNTDRDEGAFVRVASHQLRWDRRRQGEMKEIELAIRANHPVVFGAPVSRAFTEACGMDVFTPSGKHDTTGWHAMIIVGVVYDTASCGGCCVTAGVSDGERTGTSK